jgi:putative nucleotidyltransferase with HDIG domain
LPHREIEKIRFLSDNFKAGRYIAGLKIEKSARNDRREIFQMKIPSKKECYQLIREMEMMEHIVAHSVQVCRVAMLLTDHLGACNLDLNRKLIQASALLHDITKTRSFNTGENHALTGEDHLSGLGYPEVGRIVGQHVRLNSYFASDTPDEAEIVNYADKRVLHDAIVSLEERMDYILQRYGKEPEHRRRLQYIRDKSEEIEERIFRYVPFSPESLPRLLPPDDLTKEITAYRSD